MRDPHSWPNHLTKAPPPNTITLGLGFSIWILGGHKHSVYGGVPGESPSNPSSEGQSKYVCIPLCDTFWGLSTRMSFRPSSLFFCPIIQRVTTGSGISLTLLSLSLSLSISLCLSWSHSISASVSLSLSVSHTHINTASFHLTLHTHTWRENISAWRIYHVVNLQGRRETHFFPLRVP